MELAVVTFGLILLLVIPSLLFLTFNHFVQFFLLKPLHHGFLKTLKKTWWISIFWTLVIIGSFITFWRLPDSMITRILVTLLILAVLLGINALNQKRMNSEEGINRDYFRKSLITSFGVSFLIIMSIFIPTIPHKIIPVTDKAKFLTHLEFYSSCNNTIKSLNERGIAKGDLLHAFYNEDDEELVAFIHLSPSERIELMNRFKFERIDTSKMGSYHFNIMNNEIKSAVTPIDIQTISPKRISQDNIYQFALSNAAISMNLASSYEFGESLNCDQLGDGSVYLQMIFDTKSNILMLVEEFSGIGS